MQLYGLYGLNRVILIIQIKNFNNFKDFIQTIIMIIGAFYLMIQSIKSMILKTIFNILILKVLLKLMDFNQ